MRRMLLICLACAFTLIVAPAIATPAQALAIGSYSIDELATQVTVETNGAAHVVERQTVTFSDRNVGLTWYLHVPEDGEAMRVSGVRVAPVDDGGTLLADWTQLRKNFSNPERQGRQPGDQAAPSQRTTKTRPWYSYSRDDGMLRCWFPNDIADSSAFQTFAIEVDYTVYHRVRVFRDVAELYWRYAHDSLPGGARNVSLQVVLPLPDGTDPAAVVESVRAWGHGPGGTFSVGENGTVTYRVDEIAHGNYAEAHVIFPASWMTDIPDGAANQFSEVRSPSAIAEESEWVDTGLREAAWDDKVRVLFLCAAVVIILLGAIGVLWNGRSTRSRRALIRVAATLAIVALGEHLFFREPLTTALLALLAGVVGVVALALPTREE